MEQTPFIPPCADLPELVFKVWDEVYEPAEDTYLLVDTLHAEKEFLYPPLTFLKPTNPDKKPVEVKIKGSPFRVVEVTPFFGS